MVGIFSSALPFLLWAYAALSVTAGVLSVLNATSPMWGALCGAVLLRERMGARRIAGLAIGIVGVALVTRPTGDATLHYPAVAAALVAAFSYGLVATYIRRWAQRRAVARHGRGHAARRRRPADSVHSALAAVRRRRRRSSSASMLALGLVCGAIAYLLYFRLIADIGATRALTVTYLIPVFGVLWGALFLGEARVRCRCSPAACW